MKRLSLLGLLVLLLAACGSEETATKETTVEKQEQPAEQTEPVEEAGVEEEKEEAKEPEYGKRSNPVPIGQTQSVAVSIYDNESTSFAAKADITINSVKRGPEVLEFVKGINEYNEAPPEGYEYIMLDVTTALTESETEDYAWWMDGMQFNFIGSDGSPYEWTSVVVEPELNGEIFVGGSLQGYVVNMVKTDDPIMVVYEDSNWENIFFATE